MDFYSFPSNYEYPTLFKIFLILIISYFFSFKDDLFFDKNYGSKCSLDYCILLSPCQDLSKLLLPMIHLNLFKSLYQYFLLVIFFFAYPFPKSILASDMLLKSFGFDTGKQYEFNVYNFEAEMII